MRGRWLAWGLLAVLALALWGQTVRGRHRLRAASLLRQAELMTLLVSRHQAPSRMVAGNLVALREAARLDPLLVGVPIARGSQHLLLGSPEAAIDSYRQALALEPRPETYLNLGRAQMMAGQVEEGKESFALAARIDPKLARYVPPAAR